MTDLSFLTRLPVAADTAWLFPGQGAQAVGMGRDLAEQIPTARAIFDAADGALGFALSSICFEGPEAALTQTVNTQPALVVHAVAALVAAVDAGMITHRPAFVAGHSLGQYAALIAVNAVPFEDGVRLVRERGRLMQIACDAERGTMAAILGAEPDAVRAICAAHGTSICNINAPGNITIGGAVAAVEAACAAAVAGGAKVIPLTVSGAFHTPLMRSAAEGMRTVLAGAPFSDPAVPVISNVTALPLTRASEFASDLVEQVTSPVLWVDSVRAMHARGVTTVIEFGPGRVLGALVKRIERSIETRNIGTAEEARG
ncbi:MAG: [acyl-carrier-protein] S-malonyltransferase [Dehalococcoidia bacterium]|nr:[acyl-carrier-protein] S-malonyltransferase [Dehalococcoidia bacterium]